MFASVKFVCSNSVRRCTTLCFQDLSTHHPLLKPAAVVHTRDSCLLPTAAAIEITRCMSRRSFLDTLIESVKQEYNKDPELQQNIKKFRQEAQDLEDSEALKKARQKFKKIEKETSQSTEAIQDAFGKIKTKVSEAADEIGKTEAAKAAGKFTEGMSQSISDAAKQVGDSNAVRKVQAGFQTIAEGSGVAPESLYRPPTVLRMRKQPLPDVEEREIQADTEATNVVMHKDSVWNEQWEAFKSSPVGERISNMKMKYDESDNLLIRGSRLLTDRISSIAGGMFGGTEVSRIMTEVAKIEPNFNAAEFVQFCRYDVIPNVLESVARGNDEVLKDWCSEAPYTQLMFPVNQAKQIKCKYHLKTIDVDNVDVVGATKVDQGPVLVVSFQSQQIMVVRNNRGEVVEGDPDRVMLVYHVWAMCRDVEELDPRAGWKIIDQNMSASPMLI